MERDIIHTQICCPDDLSDEIRKQLAAAPDHFCAADGMIYLMIDRNIFRFSDDDAGKALATAIAQKQKDSFSRPQSRNELYKRILEDPDYKPDQALLRQYGLRKDSARCTAVFRSFSPIENDLYTILSSMAPVEKGDVIIPTEYQSAVLIKDPDGQTEEEITEFIEAVIGTMEAEGIDDICAGIGRSYPDITGIRRSYLEGKQALQIGRKYRRQDHVYVYSRQTLERIVNSIPEEKKAEIRNAFFGSRSASILSDEMLETVRVFFRNDLNLTAASKQLFIHRNTLNYRLDKIKKDFGLDLRVFHDAVIFRVITEIAKES